MILVGVSMDQDIAENTAIETFSQVDMCSEESSHMYSTGTIFIVPDYQLKVQFFSYSYINYVE